LTAGPTAILFIQHPDGCYEFSVHDFPDGVAESRALASRLSLSRYRSLKNDYLLQSFFVTIQVVHGRFANSDATA
jgi:hypothetical protein